MLQAFDEASNWLYKKRRRRQANLQWSVNRDSLKLDRAGQTTNSRFWCISHDLLTRLLNFEMQKNNVLQAVGTLWRRDTSIPMGGPFSTQSANVHTLWRVRCAGKKLRDRGTLSVFEEGYPLWQRGPLWFNLC